MNLIAAVSNTWGIGKDNDLLFHIKEDMKFFKETTINNVVVMGRKTLDSFPNGNPLKERVNIVITRNKNFERERVVVVHSIEELLEEIKKYNEEIFVIGGGEIYNSLLPYCDTAYITKVNADKEADTFLLNLDEDEAWSVASESEVFDNGKVTYKFVTYKRN